jgi:hypothetical protein
MSPDHSRVALARNAVRQFQNPSVSALQRALKMSHDETSALVAQLQEERVLLAPLPGRAPGLHPDYRRHQVRCIAGNGQLCYTRQVAHAALLCFELAEEGLDGDSEVLQLHVLPGIHWTVLRTLFLKDWYGQQRLSLTSAALAYHAWLQEQGAAPADGTGLAQAIITECLPYERPRVAVVVPEERLARSYVRLARFYRRALAENGSRDTRIAVYYIRDAVAPQNVKRFAHLHPEHVVPCAVLRDIASAAFEDGASVRDVAEWIQRRMVIAWIDKRDAQRLDGELGLRNRMTPNWDAVGGCCYTRLHSAAIQFDPAPSHPCTCGQGIGDTSSKTS